MGFSLFPAFFDNPSKIRFADQEIDENIEILVRQHGITNVPWIITSLVGAVLPLIIPSLVPILGIDLNLVIPADIQTGVLVLWYLLIAAYVLEEYLNWYFNIYIVTNLHLVDIDFFNLLNRRTTEVLLDDVQSASTRMQGILSSLFNFGDVVVETAAERQNISFEAIPYPDVVAERIQDLQSQVEGGGSDVG